MNIPLKVIAHPQFLASYDVLAKLPLPAKTSYWLARVARVINDANRDFQAARLGVFQRLGTLDEATQQYVIDTQDAAKRADYESSVAELLEVEVDLPITEPIRLPAHVTVQASDLMPLLDLVALAEDPPNTTAPARAPAGPAPSKVEGKT